MTEKLNPPAAVCTKCGKTMRNLSLINEQCGERPGGKRCQGVYGSALNVGDWEECSTCKGTGRERDRQCTHCTGDGWLYVRNRRR
jgi:hypothetical protein